MTVWRKYADSFFARLICIIKRKLYLSKQILMLQLISLRLQNDYEKFIGQLKTSRPARENVEKYVETV